MNIRSVIRAIAPLLLGIPAVGISAERSGDASFIASDGTRLHVEVNGSGPPCIFVHGGPGQGFASFRQMKGHTLERFLTMIYLDQRGSGSSAKATNYHLARIEADIDEVRKHLDLSEVCLIAHSFGGLVAVNYAAHYPQRVSALVMVNALLQFRGPYIQRMQVDFVNEILGPTIDLQPDAERDALTKAHLLARETLMKTGNGYRFLTDHPSTIQTLAEIDNSYDRQVDFGNAVIGTPEKYPEYYLDHAPLSRHVMPPTLIIAGTNDRAVGPKEHRRFRFPCSQTQVINGGHLLYFELSEEFAGAVKRFMASQPHHAGCKSDRSN